MTKIKEKFEQLQEWAQIYGENHEKQIVATLTTMSCSVVIIAILLVLG